MSGIAPGLFHTTLKLFPLAVEDINLVTSLQAQHLPQVAGLIRRERDACKTGIEGAERRIESATGHRW
jgi:hypothetical protein